ncbi:GTPase [Laribacter hongkongensis]|uniref:GTPase n=1 Tax=Laribacter hongkongensis TaxID=168471 RepID=UPI001EFDF822|nr:GTPase [Laribacter hongkongensis]
MRNAKNNIEMRLSKESETFSRLCTLLQSAQAPELPQVVVCGLLKAGKSSLLNALTGHLEEELFATDVCRATVSLQSRVHCGCNYVDTPGIDACSADDAQAWRALEDADAVLFVHNLRDGAIDACEAGFLGELQQRLGGLSSRLLVVFSHADGKAEAVEAWRVDAEARLQAVLGFAPECVSYGFRSYRKGVLLGKPRLVELSGFAEVTGKIAVRLAQVQQNLAGERARLRQHRLAAMQAEVAEAVARRTHLLRGLQQQQQAEARLRQAVTALGSRLAISLGKLG